MIVNKNSIYNFRIFTDFLLLNASFILAAVLAQSWEILLSRPYMFLLLILLNLLWQPTTNTVKLYDDLNNRLFSAFVINIIKIITFQIIIIVSFIFIVKEDLFTRNFILYYGLILAFAIILKEFILRKYLTSSKFSESRLRKLIIVGETDTGYQFKDLIENNPSFGYNFLGFIDDETDNEAGKTLGKISELETIISKTGVDNIVIALPLDKSDLLENLLRICDRNALQTYIIPDYFRFVSNKFKIELLGNFPVIAVRNNPLDEIQWRILKRTFDISFTLFVFFTILWWLIPLIYLAVKFTSKGPGFFIQERIGRNNSVFKCYKFRTMNLDASMDKNSTKPVTDSDERITPIGKILRRTNIDELPQFLNVIKGEMSIVGPRPHAIPFNNTYQEIVEEIKLRHRVNPGITGWAQIHGLRGDTFDFENNKIRTRKRVEHDIWYIENWSFFLDIQIILETILQIFGNKNKGN
ncbi:UDP-glucose:undecaprenyl-phosphate glucose-1-phosphate transferase [bacterium BMS3Abin04]|nr:UDP-glucose:undecaprenyl-phosphate glucose-1-phosphate transferase [bacterium BMS3Abin04]